MASKTNKKRNGAKCVLANNMYMVKLLFGAAPIYGISIIVEAVRHNLINFLEQTICVYIILDAIETGKPYKNIVYVVALFLVVDLLAAGISNLYEHFIKIRYLPLAQKKMKMELYEKAKNVDISCYDNTEYYNNFVLSIADADKMIDRTEQLIRMFFGCITVLICYGGFFLSKDKSSVIFVAVSFVLRTLFSKLLNEWSYKIRLAENPLERKREYIKRVFYLKKYAKEIRLNKAVTKELHKEFDVINEELCDLEWKMGKKKFLLDFIAKYMVSDFALDILYVLFLVIKAVVYRAISYSTVVVLYNSAANLRKGFSTIMDLGPFAVETSLYIDKIRTFLEEESTIKNRKQKEMPLEPADLECKNVSFGYCADRPIIKNINLTFHAGEKVALVGFNGAGKTTLIKLLLRLYEPSEGEILLNGVNIKEYDIEDYRRYIGVVFQDFQLFATSVCENVIMDKKEKGNVELMMQAIRQGGFIKRFSQMKNGLDTQLSQEFDDEGEDLSGGEEQKLAVSRAFYRKASLLMLDEPSSALDPIAEYELNKAMNEVAKEKNVLFISHRLSTTRTADKIYVMDSGEIVEQGTHQRLLQQKGVYAKMWNAQAQRYSEEGR